MKCLLLGLALLSFSSALADQAEAPTLKGTSVCPARILSHIDKDGVAWLGQEAQKRLEIWTRAQLTRAGVLASEAECKSATRKLTPFVDLDVSPDIDEDLPRAFVVTLNLLDMNNEEWGAPVVAWQRLSFGNGTESAALMLEAAILPLVQRHMSTLTGQFKAVNPAPSQR